MIGPGARLRAPVLDDLDVLGGARRARLGERVAGTAQERGDQRGVDLVERPMLARRRDDRPPAAGRPGSIERDLGEPAVQGPRLCLGADDVEREVLEHPDADAVTRRIDAVAALAVVLDRLGRKPESIAMERAIDDGRDPPAGDGVLAQLEQAGRHGLRRPRRVQGGPSRRGAASARRRTGGRLVRPKPCSVARPSGRARARSTWT